MTISRGCNDMDQPTSSPDDERERARRKVRKKAKKVGRHAVRLTGREYLPMALTLAFWGTVGLTIGHADAARLLAATVLLRAPTLLSQLNTVGPLRRRRQASRVVRALSRRRAIGMQFGVLVAIWTLVAGLSFTLDRIGQPLVASMLLLVAIGIPARLFRSVVPRAMSRYVRLGMTGSALAGAGIAWALGSGPLGFALAFGLREWGASLIGLLFPTEPLRTRPPTEEPITLAEVAKHTVVNSRRLLTYRLTKNILTVFGPFGNFAARTGRGFNLHSRLEPYVPHKRAGFAIFALLTAAIAAVLIWRSGEPLAMVAGAGAVQLCAIALNVLLWWRYLPNRDDPSIQIDEDEDD